MEYVLMCTKSKQIHYVSLTTTRAIKKVTDLKIAIQKGIPKKWN